MTAGTRTETVEIITDDEPTTRVVEKETERRVVEKPGSTTETVEKKTTVKKD